MTGANPARYISDALLEGIQVCLSMTLLPSGKSRGLCIAAKFRLAGQLGKLNQRALSLWTEHRAELCDDPRLDELIIEV